MKFDEYFAISDRIFALNGFDFIPRPTTTKQQKLAAQRRRNHLKFSTFIVFLSVFLVIICVLQHIDNLFNVGSVLSNLILIIMTICKFLVTYRNRERLREVRNRLKMHFEKCEDHTRYMRNFRYFGYYQKALIVGIHVTEIMFFLTPIANGIFSVLKGQAFQKVLHHKLYVPFDYETSWTLYLIAESFVKIAAFYIDNMLCGSDIYFCCFLFLLATEFNNLGDEFEAFDFEYNDKEKLKVLVKRHEDLLDIRNELEGIFSLLNLISFLGSTFLTCFSFLQIFSNTAIRDVFKFCSYLNGVTVEIFFLCLFCELLKASNEGVYDKIMKSNWYLSNKAMRKNVNLVSMRSQISIELSAGGFFTINMTTFTTARLSYIFKFFKFILIYFLGDEHSIFVFFIFDITK